MKANAHKGTNSGNTQERVAANAFRVRAGQLEFERGVDRHRVCGLIARRQYGKTTIASRISLKKMMRTPGHTVVFGSVKVDLGREIVLKDAQAMQKAIRILAEMARSAKAQLELTDGNRKGLPALEQFNPDDFADLYEAGRLEFKLWHDRTTYSRTKVVALTPAAVGETGDLILDEVGRVKKFREVWEAVRPIIMSNPEFRCLLTTTPPPDSGHYSYELLAPPLGGNFPVNPKGNWYRSDEGYHVLRITAWDAFADGVPLYDDDTGAPIDPDTARQRDHDKDAWDRNYGCVFTLGGTAAVGLIQLDTAQRKGMGKCACIIVDSDMDFDRGLAFLLANLGEGPVGIGGDIATTEKATSNPSSFTVVERRGLEVVAVLTVVWKTRDPRLAKERIRRVVETVAERKAGGAARLLALDATSERLFCSEVQRELAGLIPVELVVASETVEIPGGETITKKALLGNRLVGALDDNRMAVAPERYIRDDFRRVKRDRGSFDCEVGPNGEHGDTFDSHKLGLHALTSGVCAYQRVAARGEARPNDGDRPFKRDRRIRV